MNSVARFPVAADRHSPDGAPALMSPGTYLRKRRVAGGLTVEAVARSIARIGGARIDGGRDHVPFGAAILDLCRRIRALEGDEADADGALTTGLISAMAQAFAFDIEVYSLLAVHAAAPHAGLPVPDVCRDCACSWNVPCGNAAYGNCAWAEVGRAATGTGEGGALCTHCDLKLGCRLRSVGDDA